MSELVYISLVVKTSSHKTDPHNDPNLYIIPK